MDAEVKPPVGAAADATPDPASPADQPPQAPTDALHSARLHFEELREYIAYLITAKIDSIKATFRNVGLYIALGVIGLFIAGAAAATSVVLLLVGLAGAVGAIFHRQWLGNLIVGFILVAAIGMGAWIFYSRFTRAARERTKEKYESLKRQQRARFGTDVAERAKNINE